MKELPKDSLDDAEFAYLDYATAPVNEEGFKSIAFKKYETEKTSILLLGDSFTWGLTAVPSFKSFADVLAARGYVVYNTGIVGNDPAYYAAIAKL